MALGWVTRRADSNGFKFSPTKTVVMLFSRGRSEFKDPNLYIYGRRLPDVETTRFLGLVLDTRLVCHTCGTSKLFASGGCPCSVFFPMCLGEINASFSSVDITLSFCRTWITVLKSTLQVHRLAFALSTPYVTVESDWRGGLSVVRNPVFSRMQECYPSTFTVRLIWYVCGSDTKPLW